MTYCKYPLIVLTSIYFLFWSFMKKKDVSMNCLPFWILELVVFTLFMEVEKASETCRKSKWCLANGMFEKFLSVYLNFLWTLLQEGKPLKKFDSDVHPLPYCGYRWCENGNCLQRDVEIWPAFFTFFKLLMKLPKAKQLAMGEKKRSLVLKKANTWSISSS